jgi:hypothetical protein
MARGRPSSICARQAVDERGPPSSCDYRRLYHGHDDGYQLPCGVPEGKRDASTDSITDVGRCWCEHEKGGVSSVGLEGGERRGTGSGLDHLNHVGFGRATGSGRFAHAIETNKIFQFFRRAARSFSGDRRAHAASRARRLVTQQRGHA